MAPSEHLTTTLSRNVPLAVAIGTEKAKSEMIVTNVLVELREYFTRRISLFSGIDFNVDVENGLTGVCDFLISHSSTQFYQISVSKPNALVLGCRHRLRVPDQSV